MSIHMTNSKTLSTANTDVSGQTGAYVTLVTGTNPGTLVDEIQISASGNSTAGVIRMYAFDPAGTTTTTLLAEYPVSAVSGVGVSQQTWKLTIRPINLKFHTNQQLRFTTHNAGVAGSPTTDIFHVTCFTTVL